MLKDADNFTGDVYTVVNVDDDTDILDTFDTISDARRFKDHCNIHCEIWREHFINGRLFSTNKIQ